MGTKNENGLKTDRKNVRRREFRAELNAKEKVAKLAAVKAYRQRPEIKAQMKAYDRDRRANPSPETRATWRRQARERWAKKSVIQKASIALYMRRYALIRKYGITPEQWSELFESQGHKCACCGTAEPGSVKGWSTDHLHEPPYTLRGILCHKCNIRLGQLGDTHEKAVRRCEMFLAYLAGNKPN